MKAKLQSDDGRDRYKMYKQTVEPVFGIIKSAIGAREEFAPLLDYLAAGDQYTSVYKKVGDGCPK